MKTALNNGRAEKALEAARTLFTTRVLDSEALRAVGIEFGPGSLVLGDHRLVGLIREAGRAPGCGTQPIDLRILTFLDNHFGFGLWQRDRDPFSWERGGGDPKLEELLTEEEAAIVDRVKTEQAMWAAWDEQQSTYRKADQSNSVGVKVIQEVSRALDAANEVWQAACKREQLARGRSVNRMSYLQERWLRQQAAK